MIAHRSTLPPPSRSGDSGSLARDVKARRRAAVALLPFAQRTDSRRGLRLTGVARLGWAACLGGLLTAGCLSRPNLPPAVYALNGPPSSVRTVATNAPVLALKNVLVSPLFDGKGFVYRLSENRYERDPYAEFLVAPERVVATAVQAYLRNTGLYCDVLTGSSVLTPNEWMEAQVEELYGDFRHPKAPAAVMALQFTLTEPGRGSPNRALFQKAYRREIPFADASAAGLAAAWNKALGEIMGELARDLRAAAPAKP